MDWARPMIVGLACCVAGAVVGLLLVLPFAESDLDDVPLYLLISAPILVGALVGGGLAGRVHRKPERLEPRRHIVIALGGPAVFALFNSLGVSQELDAAWLFRLLNLVLPLAAGYAGFRLLDH